jgi:hypothetical protein
MYLIKIIELKKETKKTKEWERLRDPYDDEKEQGLNSEEKRKSDPQFDYVETEREVEVENKIYEQVVDDIDLESVITAVNDISRA